MALGFLFCFCFFHLRLLTEVKPGKAIWTGSQGFYPECSDQQALKSLAALICTILFSKTSITFKKKRWIIHQRHIFFGCFLSCLIFAWIKMPSTSDAWDSWGIKFTYYQSKSHFWPLPSPTGTKVWAGFLLTTKALPTWRMSENDTSWESQSAIALNASREEKSMQNIVWHQYSS